MSGFKVCESWIALLVFVCTHNHYGKAEESLVNVALNKPGKESSMLLSKGASYAVDGILDDTQKCQMTRPEKHNWMRIDLGDTYGITQVKIANSNHFGGLYLKKFYVYVSLEDPYPSLPFTKGDPFGELCVYRASKIPEDGKLHTLACGKTLTGRYVTVYKPDPSSSEILGMCELEVMAGDHSVSAPIKSTDEPTTPPNSTPESTTGHLGFVVSRGKRSTSGPFYTATLARPYPSLCVTTCMTARADQSTQLAAQLDTVTRICECIAKTTNLGIVQAGANWILMETENNNG